ncbi:hypothetical protein F53441_11599 [Fusarium austroafricanum]|uniref:Uncharacterized protein n=1 Tax=Fusarium austroafricanum TaxID=2364996 RepID=A0A8H4K387_9HYPO|nr:hypothetical protein F53441_11599 [Fusarium austroafricanum]
MGAYISIQTADSPTAVAGAIFNGPGVSVTHAEFLRYYTNDNLPTGKETSGGIFTSGPFGIGSGGILTISAAQNAGNGGRTGLDIDTNAAGSPYCEPGTTTNGAVLSIDIVVGKEYNGLLIEFILATLENFGQPDSIGIQLDNVLYSVDSSQNRITATSEYMASPIGIQEPPLISFNSMEAQSPPGEQTMVFAICDANNGGSDSGLMVKARGCVNCDSPIKINYATTTVTTGPTSFVSTIQASGTVSGTVIYGVPEATTATTEETTSTETAITASETTATSEVTFTSADTTTATNEDTTTTTALLSITVTSGDETAATTTVETTSTESETTTAETTATSEDTTITAPLSATTATSNDDAATTTDTTTTASGALSSDITSSTELPSTTVVSTLTTANSGSVSATESISEASTSATGTTTAFDTHTTTASTSQGFTTRRRRCRP